MDYFKPLKESFSRLREKDVINAQNGAKLGRVCDLELEFPQGSVSALLLPERGSLLSFGKKEEVRIPLEFIESIGEDVIIVRSLPNRTKKKDA